MAESLAIIGAVAAVSQVTSELVKLTTNLRHYLKVIRRAPEEVQAFVMETSNFTGILNFFAELADNPIQNIGRREQKRRDRRVSMVQKQCAYVCDKMEYLVDRFAGLAKGNLTPLESLVERIKYILDKPDIKDLRLSVQSATTTINTMSTLFLWEEAKNDARRMLLLEQLRNLLPMGKKISAELAAHQQRHGIKYESEMPDPNNAILAASKETQRQAAHIIKLRSRFEADVNEGWVQSPRDSFSEQASLSGPRSSPPGSGGSAIDSARHIPRQKANRVSFKNSIHSRGNHLGDHGVGASQKGAIAQSLNSHGGSQSPHAEFLSLPADSARNQGKRVRSRIPSEDWERVQAAREGQSTVSYSICSGPMKGFTFDISDSMKPCIHACTGRCNIEYCSLCDRSHCIRDYCLSSEDTEPAEDKTLDSNVPEGLIPLPEPKRAASNERSSREGTRSSYEEQARHSPPTTIESEEESRLSDTEIDPAIRRWSPTDIALPSSKSSSSSTESPRSPDAKDRISTTACPAETEPQEAPDLGKKVSEVYDEKRPRLQTEQEQSRHLGSAVEIRQLEAREKEAKEERWRESESAPYKSHVSNDSIASSGQGHPSPYVPMAPFGGPGGRRRPRRPHLRQRGD